MKKLILAFSVVLLILAIAVLFLPAAAGSGVQLQTDQAVPSLVQPVAVNQAPALVRESVAQNNNIGTSELIALSSLALIVGITVKLCRKHNLSFTTLRRFAALCSGANTDRRAILNCPRAAA